MAAGKGLFVGRLKKRERERLEAAKDTATSAKYRDRCRAILWSAEGKKPSNNWKMRFAPQSRASTGGDKPG